MWHVVTPQAVITFGQSLSVVTARKSSRWMMRPGLLKRIGRNPIAVGLLVGAFIVPTVVIPTSHPTVVDVTVFLATLGSTITLSATLSALVSRLAAKHSTADRHRLATALKTLSVDALERSSLILDQVTAEEAAAWLMETVSSEAAPPDIDAAIERKVVELKARIEQVESRIPAEAPLEREAALKLALMEERLTSMTDRFERLETKTLSKWDVTTVVFEIIAGVAGATTLIAGAAWVISKVISH